MTGQRGGPPSFGTCDVAVWFPPAALRNAVWAGKTDNRVGLCSARLLCVGGNRS